MDRREKDYIDPLELTPEPTDEAIFDATSESVRKINNEIEPSAKI